MHSELSPSAQLSVVWQLKKRAQWFVSSSSVAWYLWLDKRLHRSRSPSQTWSSIITLDPYNLWMLCHTTGPQSVSRLFIVLACVISNSDVLNLQMYPASAWVWHQLVQWLVSSVISSVVSCLAAKKKLKRFFLFIQFLLKWICSSSVQWVMMTNQGAQARSSLKGHSRLANSWAEDIADLLVSI